jgi:hypothetical protein
MRRSRLRTRARRDHEKYLTLIDTVAFLHQHQRERKTVERDGHVLAYIEVTREDIAVANRLAVAVLGRSLDDLPPQRGSSSRSSRRWCRRSPRERLPVREVHFTRRTVRHFTGWTDVQVLAHLAKLHSLAYVVAHHGMRVQRYVYELLYLDTDSTDAADRAPADARAEAVSALNLREYGGNVEGRAPTSSIGRVRRRDLRAPIAPVLRPQCADQQSHRSCALTAS